MAKPTMIQEFIHPCPVLPTLKEFVDLGDWTLRYGMEHRSVRVGARFMGSMHLRMKRGLPPKDLHEKEDYEAFRAYDERRPDHFAELYEGILHPYLVELARGRYVMQGGAEDQRVVLDLKSKNRNEPAVRCFVLDYDDLRVDDPSFIWKWIPFSLMEKGMQQNGKFAHNSENSWMIQGLSDGTLCEELFLGVKPEIESFDVERRTALVKRSATLIVLQGNFYERAARVEKFWHDSVVVPYMYGNANVREKPSFRDTTDATLVDATGLAPKHDMDVYWNRLAQAVLRKEGMGTLTAAVAKPKTSAETETPEAAEATPGAQPEESVPADSAPGESTGG